MVDQLVTSWNDDATAYYGNVRVGHGGGELRARLRFQVCSDITLMAIPNGEQAADRADLELIGFPAQGRHWNLFASVVCSNGFNAEVAECELVQVGNQSGSLQEPQIRKASLVLEYVAPDVDMGAVAISGCLSTAAEQWNFRGVLDRAVVSGTGELRSVRRSFDPGGAGRRSGFRLNQQTNHERAKGQHGGI